MSHDHSHHHHHEHGHGHSCGHGHEHGHGHGHGHGHHHHGPADLSQAGRRFAWAIGLNVVFVGVEFVYGVLANSTALMADAGHNLSDVLGLVLAWGAAALARRSPSARFTYGLRGSSILAALLNALLLMLACGAIAWEAAHRFSDPAPVQTGTIMLVAGIGILINGASAWLFMAGSDHDLNQKAAFQHMAADAAISLGVVISGLLIAVSGAAWIDPLVSLLIVGLIVVSTWSLLAASLRLVLGAVPDHVDPEAVTAYLRQQAGVADMHDLHIWAMSTTETALTVHLVMPAGYPGDAEVDRIAAHLKERFAIHHCTLQVEQGTTAHACALH
ncbi:cation diffusion facilitator family transporter [Massilia sp. TS11]|uniref:cation diffusion facilitator family transporter n=1 Tax=Massilia sp. TS11 TaxID=2908003 RepID=UPI001ED9DF5F|nr:cation diffusion facilitator family transporter [Massilia sp. TS11]MCG2586409.1 cation diffusion facilitator family transporter [Massilia sp. TS11]